MTAKINPTFGYNYDYDINIELDVRLKHVAFAVFIEDELAWTVQMTHEAARTLAEKIMEATE